MCWTRSPLAAWGSYHLPDLAWAGFPKPWTGMVEGLWAASQDVTTIMAMFRSGAPAGVSPTQGGFLLIPASVCHFPLPSLPALSVEH